MRKFLTYIMICSFIVSCDSGSGLPEVEETIDESYSFLNIEYYAADSYREFSSYALPSITFSNNTDGQLKYPYTLDSLYDSSLFVTDDWDSVVLKAMDGIKLFVPADIDENNKIYLGGQKWKYSTQVQKQGSFSIYSDIVVLPRTAVTINCRVRRKQYKANYKLLLKGDMTGTLKTIEGTWTGVYFDYPQFDLQSSD